MKMTLKDGRVIEGTPEEMTTMLSAWISTLGRPRPSKARLQEDPGFAEFWALYPRKVSRYAASRAFTKALQTANPIQENIHILTGLQRAISRWKENAVDLQYIPHPSTWLNQKRWHDDPESSDIQNQIVEDAKRKLAMVK